MPPDLAPASLCALGPIVRRLSHPTRTSESACLSRTYCRPWRLEKLTLLPLGRRRQQRHRAAIEQRTGRRPDQPPQDPQACNVRQGESRAAEGTNAATDPHKVRKTRSASRAAPTSERNCGRRLPAKRDNRRRRRTFVRIETRRASRSTGASAMLAGARRRSQPMAWRCRRSASDSR